MSGLEIKENNLKEAVAVSFKIPEFIQPYDQRVYDQRLKNTKKLILTACLDHKAVGFKIAYDRFKDDSLYSWMGAVLPEYRRLGLAAELADYQEKWAFGQGFKLIRLKTLSRHIKMIAFSKNRGFKVIKNFGGEPDSDHVIWMEKILI